MNKGTVLFLLLLLMLIPFTSASTLLKLKTLPGHDVYISVWNTDFTNQIESPTKYLSDIYGIVEHTYEGTNTPFGVLVIVKAFDVEKYREKMGPYTVGSGTVQLNDLLPEDYIDPLAEQETPAAKTEEPNETAVEPPLENVTEEIQNTTEESNATALTGNVALLSGITPEMMKIVYYVMGGILVLGFVFAITVFAVKRSHKKGPTQYGMEPVRLNERNRYAYDDKDLDNIEKEIDSVERQIEQYKKRSRLDDAQQRLQEKKRFLEGLKHGERVASSLSKFEAKSPAVHKERSFKYADKYRSRPNPQFNRKPAGTNVPSQTKLTTPPTTNVQQPSSPPPSESKPSQPSDRPEYPGQ